MDPATFSSIGRVEAIRRLFEKTPYKPFQTPLSFEADARDNVLTSTVLLLEGVDFDLMYFPLRHLGAKAVLAATGELYAKMAHPKTLAVTLGISAKLDYPQISELWEGLCHAARDHSYLSMSLDLQPSRNGLTINVCATGAASRITTARCPEPKSKDLLCVSGSLGAAYLGLNVLEKEKAKFEKGAQAELDQYRMLVAAYLKPELQAGIVGQMEEAGIYPSYGCFVRQGLSAAVLRMAEATGLGSKIYADRIPFEGGSFDLGRDSGIDTVSAAMNGGDDYKLLFAIPINLYEKFRKEFQTFDIIGHLALPEVGSVLCTPEGVELPLTAQGFPQQ